MWLFVLSTAFPIVAGALPDATAPRWFGIADVVFAALTFIASAVLVSRERSRVADADRLRAWRISQQVSTALPFLLVVFFVAGDRVRWQVLVIGLAWRAWLLLYTLPSISAALPSE